MIELNIKKSSHIEDANLPSDFVESSKDVDNVHTFMNGTRQ